MTLVEVLVSLAIVFVIFMGMSSGGLLVLDQNIKNTQRDEAVSVAEMEMQQVRNTPFASIVDNTHIVPRLIRGNSKDYTVQRTVTLLDAGNREVAINVSWTRLENGQTITYNHLVRTIVRTR
jgi:type II secretory pathway pseudopilin PulG